MASIIWALMRMTGFRAFMAAWKIMATLLPAHLAPLFLGSVLGADLHPVQDDAPGGDVAVGGQKAHQGHADGGLAAAAFAHQAQGCPASREKLTPSTALSRPLAVW